jgi:hypothetical protein
MQIRPDVQKKYDKAIELVLAGKTLNAACMQAGTWPQMFRKYLERARPEILERLPPRKGRKPPTPKAKLRPLHETIVVQNSPDRDHVYFVSGPADIVEKLLGVLK